MGIPAGTIGYLPNGYTPTYTTANGTLYIAGGNDVNCTVSTCPISLSVYGYRPSIAASSVLIALYAVCMAIQAYVGYRYRKWGFSLAMILGCLDEILGYVGRILYWQKPWGQAGFIMQIVLITIGPVFFSAAIYVLLALIVKYISVSHSRFAPKYIYWGFIPCDILSLVLQAVGGAMSSTSNGKSTSGVNIALAGLGFQVATLVCFSALCIDYAIISRSVWTSVRWPRQFKTFIGFLVAAVVLILVRCCYRIYELSNGYDRNSAALRDQNLFIGLESVMVILAAYCLVFGHPAFVFKTGNEQLRSDEPFAEKNVAQHQQTPETSASAV